MKDRNKLNGGKTVQFRGRTISKLNGELVLKFKLEVIINIKEMGTFIL